MNRSVASIFALTALVTVSSAQSFGNAWVEFTRNDGTSGVPPLGISNSTTEVDFAWGDLDQNGWTDLIVVRKLPFSTAGKETNQLFMNDRGVFSEQARDFARASDVPGDQGFMSPTNDRDVEIVDVDNDGWLDVITSIGREEAGDSKAVGHPRVYMNLGEDVSGNWLGLRYEESRFPQLLSTATGVPMNPVFCSVSVGDVTNDGFADLYFVHYDFSNNGFSQTAVEDLNDRLLVNDGNGYFTDESKSRMTPLMLESRFGLSSAIEDMNGDGLNDILKNTSLANPYFISVSYNNPANPGTFQIFDDFHDLFSPYHIDVADLNQDGRLDIVMGDDDPDRYRFNLGNDPLGRVIWGPAKVFTFLSGSDDGFAGQNLIADLDNDGWPDALMGDVDTDEPGFNRRLNIFHNQGGAVGAEVELLEERQQQDAGGWVGAVGLKAQDAQGTYDVATFDIDLDGDLDLVLGRYQGTFFWINQTVPNQLFTDKATISVAAGGTQVMTLVAGPSHAGEDYFVLGSATGIAPAIDLGGGVELPLAADGWTLFALGHPNAPPYVSSLGTLDTDGAGTTAFSLPTGLSPTLAGLKLWHAFAVFDATGTAVLASNPLSVELLP